MVMIPYSESMDRNESSAVTPRSPTLMRPTLSIHESSEEETPAAAFSTATTMRYRMSKSVAAAHYTSWTRLTVEQSWLLLTIAAWYLVGALAIVTTKELATSWNVPPLLLTTQQMLLSSTLLKLVLGWTRRIQPWPSETVHNQNHHSTNSTTTTTTPSIPDNNNNNTTTTQQLDNTALLEEGHLVTLGNDFMSNNSTHAKNSTKFSYNSDFILAGLFNALDFLASNAAFHASAASFVETIKASEPITTTIVALLWKIDRLTCQEGTALWILIVGVFLSTYDNAHHASGNAASVVTRPLVPNMSEVAALESSARTALTVMTANICFAFRALCQKRYRANLQLPQLNDVNLLFRMQQMGACLVCLPALIMHGPLLRHAFFEVDPGQQQDYVLVALVNAASFAVYNAASCYVLSHVSVLHHSSLNCLRRMFVTIVTCFYFGMSVSAVGSAGIALCFSGFVAFSHFRTQRRKVAPLHHNASNMNHSHSSGSTSLNLLGNSSSHHHLSNSSDHHLSLQPLLKAKEDSSL